MGRKYKGSFTIETALLMPIIALVFVVCVWGGFYYHDKNVLSSCAYESAVVGSTKAREEDDITEEQLREVMMKQLERKCILLSEIEVAVHIGDETVEVQAAGARRYMKTVVKHTAVITQPEAYIRKIQ